MEQCSGCSRAKQYETTGERKLVLHTGVRLNHMVTLFAPITELAPAPGTSAVALPHPFSSLEDSDGVQTS